MHRVVAHCPEPRRCGVPPAAPTVGARVGGTVAAPDARCIRHGPGHRSDECPRNTRPMVQVYDIPLSDCSCKVTSHTQRAARVGKGHAETGASAATGSGGAASSAASGVRGWSASPSWGQAVSRLRRAAGSVRGRRTADIRCTTVLCANIEHASLMSDTDETQNLSS